MMSLELRNVFKKTIAPLASQIERETGIKSLISMTQAALESNWGQSELTQKANNLFGFTGESWESLKKPIIYMSTRECINGKWISVRRPFRAYKSWEDSLRDWARLMETARYAKALEAAKSGDLDGFSKEVSRAGYATDPKYSEKLVQLGQSITELA